MINEIKQKALLKSNLLKYSAKIDYSYKKPRILNYRTRRSNKIALVDYIPEHMVNKWLGLPVPHFSNQGMANVIPKAIADLGYKVDVIDWEDTEFSSGKKYDLMVLHGAKNFNSLKPMIKPDTTVVAFVTTMYWRKNNQFEDERLKYFEKRHGQKLPRDRYIYENEDGLLKRSDGIICLGNSTIKQTYAKFGSVFNINIGTYRNKSASKKQFNKDTKNNFLFYSSWGNIHKGLDLLLDCFAQLPEKHLYICTRLSPEFENIYKDTLKLPNIHFLGFIPFDSPEFYKLTSSCVFNIFPSCAEGSPGSVVECMLEGVIPITSPEAGIDLKDFGITINDPEVEKMMSLIEEASQMSSEELKAMSRAAADEAHQYYSEEVFSSSLSSAVKSIIESKTGRTI